MSNKVLGVLASAKSLEKERKCVQIRKKKIKLSCIADDIIVYIKYSKEFTKQKQKTQESNS